MNVIAIVTLHDASAQPFGPYSKLHFEMSTAHFSRQIRAVDGKYYDLPHSVYVSDSYSDLAAANLAVKLAANAAWQSNDVMTIDANAIMWNGLRESVISFPNVLGSLLGGGLR